MIKIVKAHGSENQFFILDQISQNLNLSETTIIRLTREICHPKKGLLGGADGVLLVTRTHDEEAVAKMRVINKDGREASMCGNGLRIVARYLAEKYQLEKFKVETMCTTLQVQKVPHIDKHVMNYQVEISPVSFHLQNIPMEIDDKRTFLQQKIPQLHSELLFSVVAVPNPHLIAFVDQETLIGDELERIAKIVNGKNPWFSDGINVSFVYIDAPQKIFVRTYERGVGFTNACGTAMSAASLFYVLDHQGLLNTEIQVKNQGGMVQTIVRQKQSGDYWMELIGNATFTHEIIISESDLLHGNFESIQVSETKEQLFYQQFIEKIRE